VEGGKGVREATGMNQEVRVGIIGDFDENLAAHKATNEAIYHAASHLSARFNIVWLPMPSFLTEEGRQRLEQLDAIWAPPGSYPSFDGALRGIQLAREQNRPFIGT
jgi:CTP synthase (UTP-ammonia lyase)